MNKHSYPPEPVIHRIPLKNAPEEAMIDLHVFEKLLQDRHLAKVGFFDNLRMHSSGCVVFQKSFKCDTQKGYRTETLYLHKLIAERYLSHTRLGERNLVGSLNGNKLDCRLSNLEYRSRSVASRKRRTSSKLGYTGVYKENNRFRAVISVNRRSVHIGMYSTPEEAALAYNRKSVELYGKLGKINRIRAHGTSGELQMGQGAMAPERSAEGAMSAAGDRPGNLSFSNRSR